jgi:YidC/Oxa1 family membrane protein insertase
MDDGAPLRIVSFDLPGLSADLVETGGNIEALRLNRFSAVHSSGETSLMHLVSPSTTSPAAFSLQMDQNDRSGLGMRPWRLDSQWETGASFSIQPRIAELPPGLEIRKEYHFGSDYRMKFTIVVANTTTADMALSAARLEMGLHQMTREGGLLLHLGPDLGENRPAPAYREQYLLSSHFYKEGRQEAMIFEKSWWHSVAGLPDPALDAEWVSIENRYFAMALKPRQFKVDAALERDRQGRLHQWILLPAVVVRAGSSHSYEFDLYAGPKETRLLTEFSPDLRPLDGMEPSILPRNISIARMMVSFLAWINGFVGNWGWSIIILTIIVRGLLFPLSHFQFKSMAKMQALRPKIEEVQARYAEDKERLQRELMKVYSEAGVNPLGGCLPILLQMPILVGLFIAFQNAIALRGVPFILWIGDLSVPDTAFYLLGIPFNPLPLIMAATMFFQQKLSPMPSADPVQKQMLYMMPVMMTVLFYNFPSGLSLYWVTQNILSIGQQYYMMRIREVPSK